MARNRVIYQSEALYVASTGSAVASQLFRVQDVSHTVDIARTDVNEFGKLASLAREVVEPPTVGTDFSYYLTDGSNETGLGFVVQNIGGGPNNSKILAIGGTNVSCVSGIIGSDGNVFQKNIYVRTVQEGDDVAENEDADNQTAIGIGNATITDWTLNAAVGDIPTVSVSTEAQNMNVSYDVASSQGLLDVVNPAIHLDGEAVNDGTTQQLPKGTTGLFDYAALRPGDITLELVAGGDLEVEGSELGMGGVSLTGLHVQNFSFNIPLSRTALSQIGSKYAYFRAPDFPVVASMSVSAIVGDLDAGNLSGVLCATTQRDITAAFNTSCGTGTAFKITMKAAELDSQNFSSTIGDNKTVDLTFSTQIGGPQDITAGVFMSGNRLHP